MIRVNLHHQWQYMKSNGITAASLNTFHSENKFLISAHDQQVLHQLEQLFQNEKNSITALINLYKEIMLSALNKLAHKDYLINALNLITEFLADKIETDSDKDLLGSIDSYQNNIVPVIAPLIQIHQLFSKIRVEVL